MNYSDKLKDPRWQKKRLEIMQRDEFTCMICGDEETTLNVHHLYYEKDKNPWDYPDTALITLCEDCHESEKTNYVKNCEILINTLKKRGVLSDEVLTLAGILNYTPLHIGWEVHLSILNWWLLNEKHLKYMWDKYFKYLDKEYPNRIKNMDENKNGKK